MAAAELTIAQIIQIKEICKYLSLNSISKANFLKGKALDERAALMIYIEGKSVEIRYKQNPNDTTLRATANYLYSLLGRWALEAETILQNLSVAPPVIAGPANRTVNVGQNATFTATVSSAVPFTVQWYDSNSNPILGAITTSFTFTNAQLSDSGKTFFLKATNSAGTATSVVAVLVVQAQIQAFAWFGPTDPFPALSGGSDTLAYQVTQTITHNSPITITWPSGAANNQFEVLKVPIGENVKTTWFNTNLNNGTIPDAVYRPVLTLNGFNYYISRVAMSLDSTNLNEVYS
jgi:hypothetical protein